MEQSIALVHQTWHQLLSNSWDPWLAKFRERFASAAQGQQHDSFLLRASGLLANCQWLHHFQPQIPYVPAWQSVSCPREPLQVWFEGVGGGGQGVSWQRRPCEVSSERPGNISSIYQLKICNKVKLLNFVTGCFGFLKMPNFITLVIATFWK